MSDAPTTSPVLAEPVLLAESRQSAGREAAWVLAWIAAWLTPFAIYLFALIPAGFGVFGERQWVGGVCFLVATALALLLFRREAGATVALAPTGPWPWVALGATTALTAAGYALAASWPLDPEVLADFRAVQLGLILMNGDYLAVKLPELVFQQALMLVLVRHLQLRGLRSWRLIGAFAIPFVGIHLPLLVFKGLAGLPFVLACAGASLIFAPLIARFERGVVFSFCVHQLAYVAVGLTLRASL